MLHVIKRCLSPQQHHMHNLAQWYNHFFIGLPLFSWDLGSSQDRKSHGRNQIPDHFGSKPAGLHYKDKVEEEFHLQHDNPNQKSSQQRNGFRRRTFLNSRVKAQP